MKKVIFSLLIIAAVIVFVYRPAPVPQIVQTPVEQPAVISAGATPKAVEESTAVVKSTRPMFGSVAPAYCTHQPVISVNGGFQYDFQCSGRQNGQFKDALYYKTDVSEDVISVDMEGRYSRWNDYITNASDDVPNEIP